jgi:hypothetical protein
MVGKLAVRVAVNLALSLSLLACATPQKADPVADYCSALTAKLRQCTDAFRNGRPDLATMDSCLHATDPLESKMQAAANSFPDKSDSRNAVYDIDAHASTYLMFLVYTPPSREAYDKLAEMDDPELVYAKCNDLVAKRQ